MDISYIYQIVMFISAMSGCLGMGVLLGTFLGLPLVVAGAIAVPFGAIYGWGMAEVVTRIPWVRRCDSDPWADTDSGCEKVLVPYLMTGILIFVLVPVFQKARGTARAEGRVTPATALPAWVAPATVALPVGLAGVVALAAWGSRSPRRHGSQKVAMARLAADERQQLQVAVSRPLDAEQLVQLAELEELTLAHPSHRRCEAQDERWDPLRHLADFGLLVHGLPASFGRSFSRIVSLCESTVIQDQFSVFVVSTPIWGEQDPCFPPSQNWERGSGG